MQVSIALIYLFSGPTKFLDGVAWRDGTAIYYISLSERYFRFTQVDFLHNILLSIYTTYATLIIEVLFPFLIWFRQTRGIILILIALLHIFIAVLMGEYIFHFNIVTLISLILFVPSSRMRNLINSFLGFCMFKSLPH